MNKWPALALAVAIALLAACGSRATTVVTAKNVQQVRADVESDTGLPADTKRLFDEAMRVYENAEMDALLAPNNYTAQIARDDARLRVFGKTVSQIADAQRITDVQNAERDRQAQLDAQKRVVDEQVRQAAIRRAYAAIQFTFDRVLVSTDNRAAFRVSVFNGTPNAIDGLTAKCALFLPGSFSGDKPDHVLGVHDYSVSDNVTTPPDHFLLGAGRTTTLTTEFDEPDVSIGRLTDPSNATAFSTVCTLTSVRPHGQYNDVAIPTPTPAP
jgi:hypothetical protein